MSDPGASDPFLAAGEYVLGTLDIAERLDAEATLVRDPAFAKAVAFWEDYLTPLSNLVAPVAPPSELWSRLALATGVRAAPTPPITAAPVTARPRFWQATTAASLLVAAGLAAIAFLPALQQTRIPVQRLAAALGPLNVSVPFLAEAQPDGRIVVTSLANASAPSGRAFQLWQLASGSTTPVSLGLLQPGTAVAVPGGAQPQADAKLLISEEPAGGSPTGLPTGQVLYGGTLTPVAQPGR